MERQSPAKGEVRGEIAIGFALRAPRAVVKMDHVDRVPELM